MSETYTAWDGNDYPMPPPEGWELRSDGRYWPADAGGGAPAAPTPTPPSPAPPPAAPGPPAGTPPQPQPTPQPFAADTATAPVQTDPPKKMNTGMIVLLVILGVIVLTVGGCVVAIAGFFSTAGDAIEEFEESIEEFEEAQEEARREVSITENGCTLVDGVPTATVRIANRSGGRSDYSVNVIFSDASGRRLDEGFAQVNSVNDDDDVLVDVTSFSSGIEGDIECDIGDVRRLASN